MKMNLENKITIHRYGRRGLKTVLFYTIASLIIYFLDRLVPSGPCVPGLGFFAFMLLIPVSFVLFVLSSFRGLDGDKSYFVSSLIHLLYYVCIYFRVFF